MSERYTYDFNLTSKQTITLLNDYNNYVKENHYKPDISYDFWRDAKKASKTVIWYHPEAFLEFVLIDSVESLNNHMAQKFISYKTENSKNFYDYISTRVKSGDDPLFSLDTVYKSNEDFNIALKGTIYQDSNKITWDDNWSNIMTVSPSNCAISSMDTYTNSISNLENRVGYLEKKNIEKEKEKNNMKKFNFDFGPCTNDNIRMSIFGLAVKNNADTWVSYNPKTNEIVDVDIFNFDGRKFMFKMPVAVKNIAVGDMVIHNRTPMFVIEVLGDTIKAVDVRAGEKKEIIPVTNMFGFNFITKIVSLFNFQSADASAENPFGNMLPFFMMNGDKDKMDMSTMILMMATMNQNNSDFNMFNNPMFLPMAMMSDKDNDMSEILMMTFLSNSMNNISVQKSVRNTGVTKEETNK